MDNQNNSKSNKVCGLGIASFVLSILSMITICYVVFSVVFGIIGIILGILSCIIERKNPLAIAGLVIGIISIFVTSIMFITLGVMDLDLLYIPEYYKNFI